MRAFLIEHLPTLANWLALGVGITNRRGNVGAGLGGSAGGAGGASTAGQPIGLLLVLTKAS